MAESADAARVVDAIRRAFSDSRYPGDEGISCGNSPETQQVAAHFRGKSWQEIDLPFIRRYDEFADASACLSFMSAAAFRYYLPAFLLIIVNDYEHAGLIIDTTISKLQPWHDESDEMMTAFIRDRLVGFTSSQREAIGLFLKYLSKERRDELSGSEIERAVEYWK